MFNAGMPIHSEKQKVATLAWSVKAKVEFVNVDSSSWHARSPALASSNRNIVTQHAMPAVTLYHNPRCSKSCQTYHLLESLGVEPKVIHYLQDPPDAKTLTSIINKLGIEPIDLIRKKEKLYTELRLSEQTHNPTALIDAMTKHPILIQRPIVVKGNKAAIGRPPQCVLEIL